MNLVDIYSRNLYLDNYGILSSVKIVSSYTLGMKNYMVPDLEKDKIYSVCSIKKCTGKFKCANECTTNCHSIMINLWDNRQNKEIQISTCGYKLLSPNGKPLFQK